MTQSRVLVAEKRFTGQVKEKPCQGEGETKQREREWVVGVAGR